VNVPEWMLSLSIMKEPTAQGVFPMALLKIPASKKNPEKILKKYI
jgi:hypothetical protein